MPHGDFDEWGEAEDDPKRTNAEWAAEQIRKHGRDRYPTTYMQFTKLVEEVGELGKELNRIDIHCKNNPAPRKLRREAADVALALYNFCAKFGIDLDTEIADKVRNDERRFA